MKTMTQRALLTVMALLFGSLFYFTACEPSVSTDGETNNLYDGLEEMEETPNVTIYQGEAVGRDAYFEFKIDNIESGILAPGIYDGWCIEWTKPIAQQGDMHANLRMYSTQDQNRWKPLNYFLNIKDELKTDDPSLTFREFQAVIWSIMPGPTFDLETLSAEEMPPRLRSDGQPNFDVEKAKAIVAEIRANSGSFEYGPNTTYAMFMQTGEDEQDVMVPVDPNTVSHGYVEGVTPSDDPQFAERTYPVIQADWEGPGGDSRWLGWNLGATAAPESFDDDDPDRAGWYFQFNRKQGHFAEMSDDGITRPGFVTPGTGSLVIREDADWTIENDSCRELLGGDWRIPSMEEWEAFQLAPVEHGGMGSGGGDAAFNSALMLHESGHVSYERFPHLQPNGGFYWTGNQLIQNEEIIEEVAWNFSIFDDSSFFETRIKGDAQSVRCIEG